jgi:pimeloyl-ACP methyl ester carboxylesterase
MSAASRAQTVEPTRVLVRDVELHYIEQGAGATVILLHGGQGDYRSWQPQMEALSSCYRVISYSRRYHYPNRNRVASTDHSALIDAEDLAELIVELDLGTVHLVGTSYGAFTALALATAHPELVRSIVLAEPPVLRWVTDTPRGSALYDEFMTTVQEPARRAFAAGDDESAMRLYIDAFDGDGTFDALPLERRAAIMSNANFFKSSAFSTDPFPYLSKDAVGKLRVPALIVTGETTDELHRSVNDEIARVLSHAERVTIPGAGHGSPRQNPRAFTAAVYAFLSSQSPSGITSSCSGP